MTRAEEEALYREREDALAATWLAILRELHPGVHWVRDEVRLRRPWEDSDGPGGGAGAVE